MKFKIDQLMRERGIHTRKELAERIGVNESSLSKSLGSVPTMQMLMKIASALEVEVRELFDNTRTETVCPHCGHPLHIS